MRETQNRSGSHSSATSIAIRALVVCAALGTFQAAFAQDYPKRPIKFVTFSAGGGLDLAARLLAQGMAANSGWQVIVDNQGGGGGVIAALDVARAQPDGYTMLVYGSTFWLIPLMRDKPPYDAIKDFTPVSIAVTSPNVFVVPTALPVKTLKDLVAMAKAKPGELNYGSSGVGTASQLWAEQFKVLAGVNMVHVPFSGQGPALNALVANQVQLVISNPGGVTNLIKGGKLRALAVGSTKRSPLMPDLPTASESGVTGFESGQITGLFGPAKMPAAIATRMSEEVKKAVDRPEIKDKFFNLGIDTVGSTPKQLAEEVQYETEKLGKLIKDLGIHDSE